MKGRIGRACGRGSPGRGDPLAATAGRRKGSRWSPKVQSHGPNLSQGSLPVRGQTPDSERGASTRDLRPGQLVARGGVRLPALSFGKSRSSPGPSFGHRRNPTESYTQAVSSFLWIDSEAQLGSGNRIAAKSPSTSIHGPHAPQNRSRICTGQVFPVKTRIRIDILTILHSRHGCARSRHRRLTHRTHTSTNLNVPK